MDLLPEHLPIARLCTSIPSTRPVPTRASRVATDECNPIAMMFNQGRLTCHFQVFTSPKGLPSTLSVHFHCKRQALWSEIHQVITGKLNHINTYVFEKFNILRSAAKS